MLKMIPRNFGVLEPRCGGKAQWRIVELTFGGSATTCVTDPLYLRRAGAEIQRNEAIIPRYAASHDAMYSETQSTIL